MEDPGSEREQSLGVIPGVRFAGPDFGQPFSGSRLLFLRGFSTGDREDRLAARKLRVSATASLVAVVDLDAECFGKAVAELGGGVGHAWFVVAKLGDASAKGLSWNASVLKHADKK